jgi:hypothetical protein
MQVGRSGIPIMGANGFAQVGAMPVGKVQQVAVGINIARLEGQAFGDASIPFPTEKSQCLTPPPR